MRQLTRSCFLLLLQGRLFLLALSLFFGTPLLSPWSLPYPLHALALILLYLTKMRLSLTLTLSLLTIWCSELTALFLFLLAKTALAYLPTALSVALRLFFLFQRAQYAQVSLLKLAPYCKLFAGLGSTSKTATSFLFSFYLTLALSSPPSFLLPQSGRFGRNCFLSHPALSNCNGFSDTCFSQERHG